MTCNPNKGQEKEQPCGWFTKDELEFIDGIGRKKDEKPTNRPIESPHLYMMSRSKLLFNYLQYTEERVNWGDIEADVVIDHAEKALLAEGV